jgi:hypothetical protein
MIQNRLLIAALMCGLKQALDFAFLYVAYTVG